MPIFVAANFAIGAVLMMRFAEQARAHMPDLRDRRAAREHEARRALRHGACDRRAPGWIDVPIHSVRLPGLVAHQEVIFGAPGQTLTLRHDTTSREAFVPGTLLAIRRVGALAPGLTSGLEALL